jgi:hypothetical protein
VRLSVDSKRLRGLDVAVIISSALERHEDTSRWHEGYKLSIPARTSTVQLQFIMNQGWKPCLHPQDINWERYLR